MAEMLLINPRARRKARRAAPARKRRSTRARRRNPIRVIGAPAAMPVARRARRKNPIRVKVRANRRRRNPISISTGSSYMGMLKDGLMGGAGAVAVDIAFAQVSKFLPATLQKVPGQVGAGDAVKMLVTIALGKLLSRATKGASVKAARGALTVQSADIIKSFVPDSLTMAGLGYSVPARTSNMQMRVGPNTAQMARYTAPGVTPLLNRYTAPGVTALLSGRDSTMSREGYGARR